MDYSWKNKKRDLTSIFDLLVKEEPGFISYFRRVSDCDGKKHEWSNCDVESNDHCVDTDFNYTQKFTKSIVVSNSDPELSRWGSIDNRLNRQTVIVLSDLVREINAIALLGVRAASDVGPRMYAGGLYWFATGSGCNQLNCGGKPLSVEVINEAIDVVCSAGFEHPKILCSPRTSETIWDMYKDCIQIIRHDEHRGAYVAVVSDAGDGRVLEIITDPAVPDNDCWVIDPYGFGIVNKKDGRIVDEDCTLDGFDGIRRKVTCEVTFELRNAKQRCCRICIK